MKILISDKLDPDAVEKMKDAGLNVTVKTGMNPDELKKEISNYEVVVVRSATKITKDVIEAAKNLKLVVRAGVGLDNVDLNSAKEKNIDVLNTPGVTTISVAEHTVGLMLALARNIPQAYASLKSGEWNRKQYAGSELLNKTLGLIGLGRIGQEVATRAKAFGMNVIAYDPILDPAIAEKLEIPLIELNNVLKEADYISLHLPLTDKTRNMISKEVFAKMKSGVRIVNCARGGIINETDLAESIKSGHIAGAAFDVFENEPPKKDNPLMSLEQFIAVPHLGASTKEGQKRAGMQVAEIVISRSKK